MASFIKSIDEAMKAAVFTKFATYFSLTTQSTDLVFEPRDVQLRKIAEKRGKNVVEFIGLWQESVSFDWTRQRTPIARRGILLEYSDSTKTEIITAKAVPVKMEYSLRFWTRSLDKVTQACEAYMFWVHKNPNLIMNYLDKYPLEIDMTFGGITDESHIVSQYDSGLYYVKSMPIYLEGWIFESLLAKTVLSIILKIYLREGTSPNYIDTLVNTYTITSDES